MTPPRAPKLSGADLASQLAGTAFPAAAPTSAPPPAKEPSKGGRPSKSGVDAIPVNVRLAQDDHAALAKIAADLHTPGRPMPTVQDIVRGLVRGALADQETLRRLVREGGI
jgi:hypothetical protein